MFKRKVRSYTAGLLSVSLLVIGQASAQTVGTADIKNGAVTTAKIKSGAIATARLKNGAVTTPKIANAAVRNAKIGNGAVSKNKLALGLRESINGLEADVADLVGVAETQQYLAIPGGQCVQANPDNTNSTTNAFYCDLSDNSTAKTDAFWGVTLPHGATIQGLKMRSFSSGGTTTCELRRGASTSGTVIATVTDTDTSWTMTEEVPLNHLVDNSDAAYAMECFTQDNTIGVIGSIYLRYANPGAAAPILF